MLPRLRETRSLTRGSGHDSTIVDVTSCLADSGDDVVPVVCYGM